MELNPAEHQLNCLELNNLATGLVPSLPYCSTRGNARIQNNFPNNQKATGKRECRLPDSIWTHARERRVGLYQNSTNFQTAHRK